MKTCSQCRQQNEDAAKFCHHCGAAFVPPASAGVMTERDLWHGLIGPHADRYMATFQKFARPSGGPRFALTWHWPAFLFEPFLWFLYRKMYVYAAIYAIGPVIAFYLTQDLSADLVWRIMAGVSANYIYFWHVKEQADTIKSQRTLDETGRREMMQELGGVQRYVVWVGVGLLVLKVAMVIAVLKEGPPQDSDKGRLKAKPAALSL